MATICNLQVQFVVTYQTIKYFTFGDIYSLQYIYKTWMIWVLWNFLQGLSKVQCFFHSILHVLTLMWSRLLYVLYSLLFFLLFSVATFNSILHEVEIWAPEVTVPILRKSSAKIPLTRLGTCGGYEFFRHVFPAICDRGPFSFLNGKLVVKTKSGTIRGILETNKVEKRDCIQVLNIFVKITKISQHGLRFENNFYTCFENRNYIDPE